MGVALQNLEDCMVQRRRLARILHSVFLRFVVMVLVEFPCCAQRGHQDINNELLVHDYVLRSVDLLSAPTIDEAYTWSVADAGIRDGVCRELFKKFPSRIPSLLRPSHPSDVVDIARVCQDF